MRSVILGLIALCLCAVVPAMAQDITPIAGTHWQLVSIDGTPVIEGSAVTLDFHATENEITGSGGCNGYSATFTRWEDAFTLSEIISTRRACVDAAMQQQEQDYFAALQSATWFEVNGDQLTIWAGDQPRLVFTSAGIVGTTWQLVSYGEAGAETPVVEGSTVTLHFDSDSQITGQACNYYGSTYTVEDDSITFDGVETTEMACLAEGVMEQEAAYYEALRTASRYELAGDTLTIWYGDDQQLNFARTAANELVGTEWQLVSYDVGTPVVEGSTVTLQFTSESNMGGNAGCNSYGGGYSVQADGITFTDVFSTLMACADNQVMQQETTYLTALQTANSYAVSGDTLTIWYGEGQQLDFVRAAATETLSS